jgi:hypothetical protein
VGAIVMKNCEPVKEVEIIKKTLSNSKLSHDCIPLVSGPELAIDKIPAPKGEK